jgi:hypothetical protein
MKEINKADLAAWMETAKGLDGAYIIVVYEPQRDINRPVIVLKEHGMDDQEDLIRKVTNGHPEWARVFDVEDADEA